MCAGCYAASEGNYMSQAEFWRPGGTEFGWAVDWPPDDIKQIEFANFCCCPNPLAFAGRFLL
jgi:hypothetical protein